MNPNSSLLTPNYQLTTHNSQLTTNKDQTMTTKKKSKKRVAHVRSFAAVEAQFAILEEQIAALQEENAALKKLEVRSEELGVKSKNMTPHFSLLTPHSARSALSTFSLSHTLHNHINPVKYGKFYGNFRPSLTMCFSHGKTTERFISPKAKRFLCKSNDKRCATGHEARREINATRPPFAVDLQAGG